MLFPVCLLIGFELLLEGDDIGAMNLDACCHASRTANNRNLRLIFPARMVLISLMSLGIWVLFIAFREQSSRTILLPVGVILILASGIIEAVIRKIQTRQQA